LQNAYEEEEYATSKDKNLLLENIKEDYYEKIYSVYEYVTSEIDKHGFYLPSKNIDDSEKAKHKELKLMFSPEEKNPEVSCFTLYNVVQFMITFIYSFQTEPILKMVEEEESNMVMYMNMFKQLDHKTTDVLNRLKNYLRVVIDSAIIKNGTCLGFGAFGNSEKTNIYFTYLFSELFSDLGDNIMGEFYARYDVYYDGIGESTLKQIGSLRKQMADEIRRNYFTGNAAGICTTNINGNVLNNIYLLLTMVLSNSEFKTNEFCEGLNSSDEVMFDKITNKYTYDTNGDFVMLDDYIETFDAGISKLRVELFRADQFDESTLKLKIHDIPVSIENYEDVIKDSVPNEGNLLSVYSKLLLLNSYYVSMNKDLSLLKNYSEIFDRAIYNKEKYSWSKSKISIMSTRRCLDFINDFDDYIVDFEIIQDLNEDENKQRFNFEEFNLSMFIKERIDQELDEKIAAMKIEESTSDLVIRAIEAESKKMKALITRQKNKVQAQQLDLKSLKQLLCDINSTTILEDSYTRSTMLQLQRIFMLSFTSLISDSDDGLALNQTSEDLTNAFKDLLKVVHEDNIDLSKTLKELSDRGGK
jgi:hypothetical protein